MGGTITVRGEPFGYAQDRPVEPLPDTLMTKGFTIPNRSW